MELLELLATKRAVKFCGTAPVVMLSVRVLRGMVGGFDVQRSPISVAVLVSLFVCLWLLFAC